MWDRDASPRIHSDARSVFNLGQELGFEMSLLDLGGGWPGIRDPRVPFEEMARVVSSSLHHYFPEEGVKIIAEPGRYYVASALSLAVNVIGKQAIQNNGHRWIMYYINDGVYGSFSEATFKRFVPNATAFLTTAQVSQRSVHSSTIWGPTCDALDLVKKEIQLPELEVGEWMVFHEAGAYTITAATTFNGFQMPSTKFFVSSDTIERLKQMPRWPSLARLFGMDHGLNMTPPDARISDEECDDTIIPVN